MRIIEFLMNNIFIVVIIFGALASIFGKAGSKRKPNQMPDFGGGGLPLSERTESQPVYRNRPEQERQPLADPSYSSREADATARTPQTAALERALPSAAASRAKPLAATDRQSASQSAIAASVKAEDIRKAVVWAEILGPPRSKRPYRK